MQPPTVGLGEAVADASADREITLEQFKEQLRRIDQTLRALPATAQARPLCAATSRAFGCGFCCRACSQNQGLHPLASSAVPLRHCARHLHDCSLPQCMARPDDLTMLICSAP